MAINLLQVAQAKVKKWSDDYINKVAKPMAVGVPQVQQRTMQGLNRLNTPIPQKYQAPAQKFIDFTNRISRPMDTATQGFVGGTTWGLAELPGQTAPQTNLEKATYGIGYGVGLFNPLSPMTKVAGALKPAFGGVQKVLGGQAGKLIAKGGIGKLAGRGIANAAQGLPYGAAYGLAKTATGQPYTGKQALGDVGIDLALGSLPLVGGLAIGAKARGFKNLPQFEGLDKKVRAEISDLVARIKPTKIKEILGSMPSDITQKSARLGDFFEHAGLFKNYPQLKHLRIQFEALSDGTSVSKLGSFDPLTFSIKIDPRLKPQQMRSTLLHEIQHVIQEIEGFAKGGSPNTITSSIMRQAKDGELPWDMYRKFTGEIESRAVERRANLTSEQRKQLPFYEAEMKAGAISPEDVITRFDSGTSMKDAKAGLYDTKKQFKEIYHGTDKVFKEFDVKKTPDGSIWFTDSKDSIIKGESGASGTKRIINRFINENDLKLAGWDEYDKYSLDQLQQMGYDGIKLADDGKVDYQIFYPEKLSKNLPNVAQQPLSTQPKGVGVTKGVENTLEATQRQGLPTKVSEILPETQSRLQQQQLSQTPQTLRTGRAEESALDNIIAQGRKEIGGKIPEKKVSVKEEFDNFYTQWVDRYNPIVKASKKAQKALKTQGAELLPQNNPEYLVRRLTGAGGIADYRFKTELQPVLKEVKNLNIPTIDMDTYLANKRIAGFGVTGREIYGADPVKAQQIVTALETKYGRGISDVADKFYKYQDKGFQEMVDAGFISPENADLIRTQNPDYSPLYRVMDELDDYLGLPTRKTMQGTQPIQKIKGSKRQIISPVESIIGNTFKQRAAIEKNRVAKSIVDLQNVADMGFKKVSKSGDDTITVWNNGQKEYWQVGREISDVAKGANEEAMNLVLKIIQAPAALLRQGATGRNPEFMIPNIIRDQLDAGVTSKYGYIPFVDYISGLKSMLTNDSVYQKWQSSGAKIALGEMSGQKTIKQLQETAKSRNGLFKKLGDFLDVMGKYSEEPTRVGLFKKAYKKTGNEMLALLESRDSTVDFARMGSKMKVANSIVPFLNVGVQGFDKLIRSVRNNPGKVLFNATLYGSAPAAALTLYNLKNYAEEYAEIPQYEKDSNFVLVKGRNENGTVDYLTFPKGNIIPTIANPVQSFIEYAYGNDQQSFGEMALQTLSSTLPVIGDGQSFQEIALKTIGSNLPQAIKPLAENVVNKSFYKYDVNKEQTKDIVPSYLQNRPKYKQSYEFTPKMYQFIGALVNASPLKVQNLMEGYLAGYSKIPAQITEMLVKADKGQEISPNEKTILRRFVKQTYPSSSKKPTPEVKSPGLMERITGEVSAAEKPKELVVEEKKELEKKFTVEEPKYTGEKILDDEIKADYKEDISKAKSAVMKAFEEGKIDQGEAMKALNNLKIKLNSTKSGTKAKKAKSIKFVALKFGKRKKITGLTKKKGRKLIKAPKLKEVKL